MAISDNKQRIMPFPEDREPRNSQELAYPEAVILTHPKDPTFQGEVSIGRFGSLFKDLPYNKCHEIYMHMFNYA
jgi:hypothetical protein